MKTIFFRLNKKELLKKSKMKLLALIFDGIVIEKRI